MDGAEDRFAGVHTAAIIVVRYTCSPPRAWRQWRDNRQWAERQWRVGGSGAVGIGGGATRRQMVPAGS